MVTQLISKQRGAVVISLSIIFLLLTTFVTLYVAKAILLEQKIVNNEMRSKLAFEAAEYGISAALEYVRDGADRDNNAVADPVFTVVDNIGTKNVSSVDNQSVKVTVTILGSEGLAYKIVSEGYSDDKTATRTITQVVKVQDALPNAPDNPFTTKGTVDINGNAGIYNPEGNSTIWSGGNVNIGAKLITEIADPSGAGYPGCMDTPMSCQLTTTISDSTVGLDVIEQDGNLTNMTPDKMFENFFGMTPQAYKDAKASVILNSDAELKTEVSANNLHGEIIWFDGDAKLTGGVVGCTSVESEVRYGGPPQGVETCPIANESPSILIVTGDFDIAGNANFYGIVFVMGTLKGTGNPNIHGAVVSAGEDDSRDAGSFRLWYNSRVLGKVKKIAPLASASGAWKDF